MKRTPYVLALDLLALAALALPAPAGAAEAGGMMVARSPVPVPALMERVEAFVTAHRATRVAPRAHPPPRPTVGWSSSVQSRSLMSVPVMVRRVPSC